MAENSQFPMYTVRPADTWGVLSNTPGIRKGQIAQLTTYMREVLVDAMREAVDETKAKTTLKSRTGNLFKFMRSGMRAKGSGSPVTISVTFLFRPWMAIHETGGTITPKKSKYLTLPMPAALRADGRPKRRSASGWKDYGTFVYTSRKTGKKFLVYKSKSTGDLVFLYYLAPRVDMPKRLDLLGAILEKEEQVVYLWGQAVLDVFGDVDLYGIAFEGLNVT